MLVERYGKLFEMSRSDTGTMHIARSVASAPETTTAWGKTEDEAIDKCADLLRAKLARLAKPEGWATGSDS